MERKCKNCANCFLEDKASPFPAYWCENRQRYTDPEAQNGCFMDIKEIPLKKK